MVDALQWFAIFGLLVMVLVIINHVDPH